MVLGMIRMMVHLGSPRLEDAFCCGYSLPDWAYLLGLFEPLQGPIDDGLKWTEGMTLSLEWLKDAVVS